jgi:hypothetical protein
MMLSFANVKRAHEVLGELLTAGWIDWDTYDQIVRAMIKAYRGAR